MTPAQLQTIEEIFHAALDHEPDQVGAFLNTACAGDELLRRRVEALLTSHEGADNFIETPAAGIATRIIENGQPDLLVGQTIGHYKISKRIGAGGMGEVYLATDITAGRKAALKLLPARFTRDAERLKRFQQEARAVVGLNHPNILTIYEIGEDNSIHYIASELIEGETLRQRLMRRRMQLSEAVDIAIQVASALAAAHETGIVHRDIKPENIMLRPDGYAKVLDFGIAKLAESAFAAPGTTADGAESVTLAQTNLGSVLGTVRYMSPEQARGGHVDKTTDIWSLGVVLYEMITGHAPFSGDPPSQGYGAAGTPQEVMSAILEKEPLPLARYVPRAPAELQQIVSKTLRKDPAQRYHSAHELLHALKELRRKLEFKLQRAAAPLWLRWAQSPVALVVMLLAAALALTLPFFRHRNLTTSLPPEKSIAVLPLENLSDDKENAFFADGVQDELLSNLSKIKDLKVISRTSVMQYKSGTRRNLKEIAQQLGASNVVEGSVRRSGDHMRVSVQLIDARTDRHLWGENYDRALADSLSLQGELATEIAAAVGATLTPQEKARVEAKPTNNPAAYDAYLRARAIPVDWGFAIKGDIESAIRLYEQAVKLDPNFTLAWAYLSIAQIQSAGKGFDSGPARAKDSLKHALALDPNLPEVHLARGYNEEDDTRALAEFRQAEQGLPNSVDAIEAIARVQRALGHWDEAVADLRRAIELDPRNISASNNLALTYCAMRGFPEAVATLDRVLAWDPTNARALLTKADALMAIGDLQAAEPLLANPELPADRRARYALFQRNYAAAIEILSKDLAVDRRRRDPEDILLLGFSQQLAGDTAAARATFQKSVENFRRQLEKVEPDSGFEPYTRALLGAAYAGLGEAASAIVEGQKAISLRPSSKNPEFGPNLENDMARIYARLGDADHAIPMFKRLLRTRYGSATFLTPATLRLDPIWDPIRNDPRFQELLAENAPLPEKSIAVLPFENFSDNKENAYFAAGIQDDVLTSLAQIHDLKVISRTSVMAYQKPGSRDMREISQALGVANVLEGSVRRTGNRVLVNVQLIDARNDRHLWAERYDRAVSDSIGLQGELATQIAAALKAKLAPEEMARFAGKPTGNSDAYVLYLTALGKEDPLAAEELYMRATALDPGFALAYARASLLNSEISSAMSSDHQARKAKARAQAEEALRLSPTLGEAHMALGLCLYWGEKNYDAALKELEVAAATSPNNAEIYNHVGGIYRRQARWRDSVASFERALSLDPRNVDIVFFAANNHLFVRDWTAATAGYKRALEIVPDLVLPKIGLAYLEVFRNGNPASARRILQNIPAGYSDGAVALARWDLAMLERDYAAAEKVLTDSKWEELAHAGDAPKTFYQGRTALARGDTKSAQRCFAAAALISEARVRDDPDAAERHAQLGLLYAYMQRKEDAIREGRRAVELEPENQDAFHGAQFAGNLALVYALLAEADQAVTLIERLVSTPGAVMSSDGTCNITLADLRLRPEWDVLRSNPRFQKILAGAEPKTIY